MSIGPFIAIERLILTWPLFSIVNCELTIIYFSTHLEEFKKAPIGFFIFPFASLSCPWLCDQPYSTTISAPKAPKRSGFINGAISTILVLSCRTKDILPVLKDMSPCVGETSTVKSFRVMKGRVWSWTVVIRNELSFIDWSLWPTFSSIFTIVWGEVNIERFVLTPTLFSSLTILPSKLSKFSVLPSVLLPKRNWFNVAVLNILVASCFEVEGKTKVALK